MFPVVVFHVDPFRGFADGLECCLHNPGRFPGKSNDGPVRGFAGVYIQEFNAFCLTDHLRDLLNNCRISAFRKIGNTLDQL
jgi:hypothetical protein